MLLNVNYRRLAGGLLSRLRGNPLVGASRQPPTAATAVA
jgi:hypothetical protein